MEYFCIKSSSGPDISVKSEIEFNIKNEPEYDTIIGKQSGSNNMTESELETEVQIKNEPEAVIWIKSEPEADSWLKSEPEAEIETKMELETDLKSEIDFGVGTEAAYNFLVRMLIVCSYNLTKNEHHLIFMIYVVLQLVKCGLIYFCVSI